MTIHLLLMTSSRSNDVSCVKHSNGCSIPGGLGYFYKDEFTPPCDRHDICYACGQYHNVSRDECDDGFLHDMKRACNNRRRRHVVHRHVHKRHVFCYMAAYKYYYAVHWFGGSRYTDDNSPDYCEEPWIPSCLPRKCLS
ncbi:hypothetical protein V1264_022342 [Littorina saxatilis]|uniref:Uncharacterized protein n=2 Tax=Littorina saxatilis TaxID=31220 RepID=A0AAN9AK60_9CAEN